MALFTEMKPQTLQSPADVREWLDRHGVTVSQWSRAHGFDPAVVFALLTGRTRGRRGMAFRAAIALGMRPAPSAEEPHPLADYGAVATPQPPTAVSRSNAHFMEVSQ